MPRKIPNKKPPKVALGKPLPEADEILQPNAAQLAALWDQYAPGRYRGLLEAESKSVLGATGEKPKGRFIWDDQRLEYIVVRTGRRIGADELHNALRAFTQRLARGNA